MKFCMVVAFLDFIVHSFCLFAFLSGIFKWDKSQVSWNLNSGFFSTCLRVLQTGWSPSPNHQKTMNCSKSFVTNWFYINFCKVTFWTPSLTLVSWAYYHIWHYLPCSSFWHHQNVFGIMDSDVDCYHFCHRLFLSLWSTFDDIVAV